MSKKTSRKQASQKPVKKPVKKAYQSFSEFGSVIQNLESEESRRSQELRHLVADILEISPFGVDANRGSAYINNSGWRELKDQYEKGIEFEYQWIQRSLAGGQKAVLQVRLVKQNKKTVTPITPWKIADASAQNINLVELKHFENTIAETRAENRVMRYRYGGRVQKTLIKGIAARLSKNISEEEKALLALAASAVNISSEELGDVKPSEATTKEEIMADEILLTVEEQKGLDKFVKMILQVDDLPAKDRVKSIQSISKQFRLEKANWSKNQILYMQREFKQMVAKYVSF